MERRLTAILAADVVGYSALMERDEAGTYARLKAGRKELFEPEVKRHHGRIFKLMGDGLLAEFSSVVDAVECAVALQRGLAERNAAVPEAEHVHVRIGINLGEVIVEGDDRYGEGVNVASRLEQLAEPGGIWVSAKVAKEVEKKLAFGFERMGAQKVKNIAEPVEAFRVKLDGLAPLLAVRSLYRMPDRRVLAAIVALVVAMGAAFGYMHWRNQGDPATGSPQAENQEGPALPAKPSIAVLPFTNLSDDPKQGYFADGIAEDLMTDLSKLSDLFVVSRNSTFSYKGKNIDVRQVARELGVRYVLEGSVRRSDDQIRINVQLIDATTGGHQWAERYDGSQADIFALQDKVTKAVVAALALQLTPAEQKVLAEHETSVPAAYDLFLRGWDHYQRSTPLDFARAIPFFEQAIELDPNYARAHAALAMVYFQSYDRDWAGGIGMPGDNAFRKARDHLKLAKPYPTSTYHQVAGNISRDRGWYDDAMKEFASAIALEPSDSWTYAYLAYALIWANRSGEALNHIETAMRLDPHHPPLYTFYKGLAEFSLDRFSDAAATFEEAARLNPGDSWPLLFLAATYGRSGRLDDAAKAMANYNVLRVKQGDVPFVMDEFRRGELPFPGRDKVFDGLRRLGVPNNHDSPEFAKLRLNASEIDALFFGHRVHGRSLNTGFEHSITISADGNAQRSGDWGGGSGTAHIDKDQLCFVWSSNTVCGLVFRNPGGTLAKENEYFWFAEWAYPFSQVE